MRDESEFKLFFVENYSKFYYFACQLVDDKEICRDIVSDAFEYIWKEYRDKEGVKNWKNYMFSFIRNKCVDYVRHQGVHEKYREYYTHLYKEEEEKEDYTETDRKIEAMKRIIAGFTPQTRLIFRRCYVDKKKYEEVAEELGVSTSAVKKHIMKALKTLREHISEEMERDGYPNEEV